MYLDMTLEREYGISIPLNRGMHYNSEAFQVSLRRLKGISGETYEQFLEKHAKKYYT